MKTSETFYDIYGSYYPAWWTQPWALIALIGGVLLIIGLIIFLILKKKKQTQQPWEWAENQLKKLSPQTCKNKNDFKRFYYAMTTILKQYFKAEDKTDEELIVFLQNQNFNRQQLEHVKQILTGATWIKFANEEAIKSQAQDDLGKAFEIIEKTKPSK